MYSAEHVTPSLKGCTPNEIYHGLRPAHREPRIEPRLGWPRPAKCAAPQTFVAGKPGARFELDVQLLNRRSHLPVV